MNKVRKQREKANQSYRRETKERRDKLKSRSQWLSEAQAAFNKFIRERDKDEPCISCQRFHNGQYHAGHYRSIGACPELRFEEMNVHKQCAPCNNHLSGNAIDYRINLVKKIGVENVEWLEGNHELQKLTIDEIKEIKTKYKNKLKELKSRGL